MHDHDDGNSGRPAGRAIAAVMLCVLLCPLVFGALLTHPSPAAADLIGHGGMVRALAVSADGTRVLTGGFDYTAKLWDFVEQKELADLNEHFGPVNAVAFVAGGKRAVTSSDDRTVILWDLEKKKPLLRFEGHTAKVMALAVSPDGRLVASGGWDRTVRLWDLATGAALRTLRHTSNISALAFSAQSAHVCLGNDPAAESRADGRRRLALKEDHVEVPAEIPLTHARVLERVVRELVLVEEPSRPAGLHGFSPRLI